MYKKLLFISVIATCMAIPKSSFAEDVLKNETIQDPNIINCSMIKGKVTCPTRQEEKAIPQGDSPNEQNMANCSVIKGKVTCPAPTQEELPASPSSMQFGEIKENQVYSQSNMPEDIKNSSSSVEVITSDLMKKLKGTSSGDILNLFPGMTVQNQGSLGDKSSFRVRGWDKVRVNLDGLRIDDPFDRRFYLDNLMTDGIDRIEIIKGPQGTTAGDQAVGGLVSIFTRKGAGSPSFEFDSGMGSYDTFKETFAFQGGNQSADYYMGITRLDTNGGMKTFGNQVRNDDYQNLTLSSNLGKRVLKSRAEVRNTFRYTDSEKGIGLNYDGTQYDPNDKVRHMDIIDTITYSHAPTDWYDYNIKLGIYNVKQKNFSLVDDYNSYPYVDDVYTYFNSRLYLSTQHNLKYKKLNTFSTGYNIQYDHYKNSTGFSGNQTMNDVFFHDVINIKDKLFIRGGTRIISNSDFGTYATPNVSAAFVLPTFKIPNSYSKIRSSFGHSINTPTIYQMYSDSGNLQLKPEKVNGWDVGFVQSFFSDKANLEVSYFKQNFKNKIDWVESGGYNPVTYYPLGQYQNVSKAESSGWETSLKLNPIPGLNMMANYTYTDAINKETGLTLPAVPKNRYNFLISYSPKERYSVYWKATASSNRVYYGNKTTKGFFDMGLGATVRLFSFKDVHVYGYGQLNNVLNDEYENYKNFKHPGISFLAGIFIKRAI